MGLGSREGRGFPREPGWGSLGLRQVRLPDARRAERTRPETCGGSWAGFLAGRHPRHAVPGPGREEGGHLQEKLRTGALGRPSLKLPVSLAL